MTWLSSRQRTFSTRVPSFRQCDATKTNGQKLSEYTVDWAETPVIRTQLILDNAEKSYICTLCTKTVVA